MDKRAVRRAFGFCSFPLKGGRLGWGCDFNDKQKNQPGNNHQGKITAQRYD